MMDQQENPGNSGMRPYADLRFTTTPAVSLCGVVAAAGRTKFSSVFSRFQPLVPCRRKYAGWPAASVSFSPTSDYAVPASESSLPAPSGRVGCSGFLRAPCPQHCSKYTVVDVPIYTICSANVLVEWRDYHPRIIGRPMWH